MLTQDHFTCIPYQKIDGILTDCNEIQIEKNVPCKFESMDACKIKKHKAKVCILTIVVYVPDLKIYYL